MQTSAPNRPLWPRSPWQREGLGPLKVVRSPWKPRVRRTRVVSPCRDCRDLNFETDASVLAEGKIKSNQLDIRDFFNILAFDQDPRWDQPSGKRPARKRWFATRWAEGRPQGDGNLEVSACWVSRLDLLRGVLRYGAGAVSLQLAGSRGQSFRFPARPSQPGAEQGHWADSGRARADSAANCRPARQRARRFGLSCKLSGALAGTGSNT